MYDNSSVIESVKNHIERDHKYFPSNTSQLRDVTTRILESRTGSMEELKTLSELDEQLAKLS